MATTKGKHPDTLLQLLASTATCIALYYEANIIARPLPIMLRYKISTTPSKYYGEGARVAYLLDFLILYYNGKEVGPWTVFNITPEEVQTVWSMLERHKSLYDYVLGKLRRASDSTKEKMLLVGGSKCLIAYPTYTIYHINMIPEIRAILLSFLIMPLKSCPTMAEFECSNTILIVKPVGTDAAGLLRSEHNANRLKSFHFEDGVSSVADYDDTRSRECTPYVSRPPELELHQQFDPGPKDATQGFFFGTDEKKCDVQLLENPDPDKNNKYGISRQHFRIEFNWDSGFLRLNSMSPTNGTRMSAPSVKNDFQLLKYNNMHVLHPAEQTKIHVGTLVFEFFPFRY